MLKSAVYWAAVLFVTVATAPLFGDETESLFPTDLEVSPSLLLYFVGQRVVGDDLQLTETQQQRIVELRNQLGIDRGFGFREDPEAEQSLLRILRPEQVRRHFQIVLQHRLMQQGLLSLVHVPEVNRLLNFDAESQRQLELIVQQASEAQRAFPRPDMTQPELRLFENLDLIQLQDVSLQVDELVEKVDGQIRALLTDAQKRDLLDALGAPLTGRLTMGPTGMPPLMPRTDKPQRRGIRWRPLRLLRIEEPPRTRTEIGKVSLADSLLNLALLSSPLIQTELGLSSQLVTENVPFGTDLDELSRCVRQLDQWISPSQLSRLRQLVLQVCLDRDGPASPFDFQEVIDALDLSQEQQKGLTEIVNADLRSNRYHILREIERDPEKRRPYDSLTRRLFEILTPTQQGMLATIVGSPFGGELSLARCESAVRPRTSTRARTATALGEVTVLPSSALRLGPIRNELQFSEEQLRKIREDKGQAGSAGFSNRQSRDFGGAIHSLAELARNRGRFGPDRTLELLSPGQLRRYQQILLQAGMRSDGPAMVFRFRFVIEALTLSEEQQRLLLEVVRDDTRQYLQIPIAEIPVRLPMLDTLTTAKLRAVLSERQRDLLVELRGPPCQAIDEPAP